MRSLLYLFILICSLSDSSVFAEDINVVENEQNTGYIFVGDSRFVGMDKICNIESLSDNYFVVAKCSMGYDWLVSEALPQVKQIVYSNKSVDEWVLISGLGVNDYDNIERYCNLYSDLSSDFNIVCLSVNPVEHSDYITNEDIEFFNKTLSTSGFRFVDSYSVLVEEGFSTVDGLHYNDETYEKVFSIIVEEVLDKH